MKKTIKNTQFIRTKLKECLDEETEREDNFFDDLRSSLNDEYISIELLKTLKIFWNNTFPNDLIYIHELLSKTQLYLPKYEPEPRNPILEKRIQNIKAQIENEAYQQMVYNVDRNSPLKLSQEKSFKDSGYSAEFKSIQGQIIVIINAVACIIGAFYFGYKAVYYSLEQPDIVMQMSGGFILAFIVAIAEVYFLFKKLNEMDTLDPTKLDKNKSNLKAVKKEEILVGQVEKSKSDKKKD